MPNIAILGPFWLIYLTEWPIMGSFDNPESTDNCCQLIQQVIIWEVIEDFMGLISANHCNLLQKRIILSNFGHLAQFYSLDMPP